MWGVCFDASCPFPSCTNPERRAGWFFFWLSVLVLFGGWPRPEEDGCALNRMDYCSAETDVKAGWTSWTHAGGTASVAPSWWLKLCWESTLGPGFGPRSQRGFNRGNSAVWGWWRECVQLQVVLWLYSTSCMYVAHLSPDGPDVAGWSWKNPLPIHLPSSRRSSWGPVMCFRRVNTRLSEDLMKTDIRTVDGEFLWHWSYYGVFEAVEDLCDDGCRLISTDFHKGGWRGTSPQALSLSGSSVS